MTRMPQRRSGVLRGPFAAAMLGLCLLAATAPSPLLAQLAGPEPGAARAVKPLVVAERHLVSSANHLASEAGREILRQGGSAVDAAIATQMVLGLVEPQSSGIGGGGFMLVSTPDGRVAAYDGRETAPAGTTPDRFIGPDGAPVPFLKAIDHGRAVGTPGAVAMLAMAHREHGKLPWAALFAPAIRLAEDGFATPRRLADVLARWRSVLESRPDLKSEWYPGGTPPVLGQIRRNPAYAATLRLLAEKGPDAFYTGAIADSIAARLEQAAADSGVPVVGRADLAAYRAIRRDALCGPYRGWTVCGMPPPSSGGVAVLQALAYLVRFDLAALGPSDPRSWHLIAEAERLAYADRDAYVGDPDHVAVPVKGLLDPGYMADRARLIAPDRAAPGPVAPGTPPWREGRAPPAAPEDGWPSTSHMAVIDGTGMAVSFTTTVEFAFGSGILVDGFVLNNQLTDFAMAPRDAEGRMVANAPAAGKRPRSSTSPTLVFDADGRVRFALGSAGGADIIGHVVQTLVGLLDWKLDPQAAVSLPLVINRNGATAVESGAVSPALIQALKAMGHEVQPRELTSGLHAVEHTGTVLRGGADPRRDGLPVGD